MMCKIIYRYWKVFQINPELQITFQNNSFVAFKKNWNLQEIIGHTIKNGKVFKIHSENRKEKCERLTHHYVASTSLKLVHYEVTKHSNYTLYFTSSRM